MVSYDPSDPEHRLMMGRLMANDVMWRWLTARDNEDELRALLHQRLEEVRVGTAEVLEMLGPDLAEELRALLD